ncbi:MAG: 50S ribosomal protein L6 [Elusimicrobia bacterium]|nr:50S ribosomal protein L6 [Elusimicrobiota bacterium]
MSRIGKKTIIVPEKIKAKIEGKTVAVEGPLGKLSYVLPEGIVAELKDNKISISVSGEIGARDALYGTARARINNMITGVANGFTKVLEINGVGFKGSADAQKLTMQLGFSHPVIIDIPAGIKMSFDPKQTLLTIMGADKCVVGNLAAQIKRIRPPEPYNGTGIRYQGERIIRKAGKTAAGVGAPGAGGAIGAK